MTVHTFANVMQQGEASGDTQPFDEPNKDDIYMLSYTSGTTGDPKAVVLTHRNLITNLDGIASVIKFYPDDVFLSLLPLFHTFEAT